MRREPSLPLIEFCAHPDIARPWRTLGTAGADPLHPGRVVSRKKKGSFGDAGKVEVKVVFAPAGRESVRVAGRVASKGARGVAGAVVAGVVFGLPGALIVTGRSGEIPAGTTLIAHVEEEKMVDPEGIRLAAAY